MKKRGEIYGIPRPDTSILLAVSAGWANFRPLNLFRPFEVKSA